ncbi:MAG: glycosyltransferase family 4 protein [Cyanobacteria bacterium P01_F01_bin.53]
MTNVLQIGKGWFPEESGGLNRYFYDCMQHLPSTSMMFQGLVAGSDQVAKTSSKRVHTFGAASTSLMNRWAGLRSTFQAMQKIQQYDLISTHFALYTFPLLDLVKQPMVVHFHGPWALEGQAEGNRRMAAYAKQGLEKLVYGKARKFIVLSEAFQRILASNYNIPEAAISVVPGGVDLERFNCSLNPEQARQQLKWESGRPTILAVRRLAKRMGLEQLIMAISQVRKQHPDVLLKIAGKGYQAEVLKALINELDLHHNVELLGYVDDALLPVCYQAADFSIVPSQSLEGFGLICLESLATGTPVLGTPVGGIPEVLRPLNPGMVLDGHQTEDLVRGINDVLSGDRVLPQAKQCRAYVEQNYSWETVSNQLRAIYQSV